MIKDAILKILKKNSILTQMKEKKEAEDRAHFLRCLKHGQPKPIRRTRPPVRLRKTKLMGKRSEGALDD